ncbi:MAG TPA: hypothetical protein VGK23_01350 [Methanomassiliicoccales archaeon]|jgi:hypothetical protein
MSDEEQTCEGRVADIQSPLIWQIMVSEPLNKDADVLLRWSRTSFFGGSPVSRPTVIEGREYALFQKCSEEWTVKYILPNAISNYRFVKLFRQGKETSLEPYLDDEMHPAGKLLGDADKMDRSGGMC